MSSDSLNQADVRCPYYKSGDGKHRITCAGFVGDSVLVQSYRRRKDYETQFSIFCCEYYRYCEIYRMLMHEYDS